MGHGQANVQTHPPEVGIQEAEDVRELDRECPDAEDPAALRENESGRRFGPQDLRRRGENHQAGGRRRRDVLRRTGRGYYQRVGRQRQGSGDQQDWQRRVLWGAGFGHSPSKSRLCFLRRRCQMCM